MKKRKEMTIFHERLAILMKTRKVSQKALADELGTHPQSVHTWIKGHNEPPLGTVLKIADRFGVSVDWMLGREGRKEKTANTQAAESRGYAMGLRLAADAMTDLAARLHDKADRTEPRI